jgi:FtsZ-interacting cell division protein ZipA
MILMSTVTIVVIVAAVIVAAVVVIGLMAVRRRRRLQQRFGPEYDRLAGERDSKRKAESELVGRERRVHGLDIQPLTDSAQAAYASQWEAIQEQFVDTPAEAVASSQLLVIAVMSELGYPAEDPDQMLADLSVEHATTLDHYRAAEETSRSAVAGTASTEDLRLAMIDYRALFRDLVGEPAAAETGSSAAESAPVTEAADVQVADTQPEMAAVDPVTYEPDSSSRTNARS